MADKEHVHVFQRDPWSPTCYCGAPREGLDEHTARAVSLYNDSQRERRIEVLLEGNWELWEDEQEEWWGSLSRKYESEEE